MTQDPPPSARDRLAVRGIEAYGHHGVFEAERRDGQRFVVDLVLGLDTRPAAASDALADTVDYGGLTERVRQAVEADPVDLIETLAERVAGLALADPRVHWTEVTIHKPHAPVASTVSDITLTITREPSVTETPNPNIVDTDTLTGEMHPIRRTVISLGSNLGERLANLQMAVDSLADTPDVWVTAVSPVYETEPVDAPEGSPPFLNAVLLADTTLAARTLLERALAVEDALGRDRSEPGEYGAPRTLDVDLVVVGDRRSSSEYLILPHPKAHDRAFVVVPWHDLEPDAVLIDHGPIAELVEKLGTAGVTRRDDLELHLQ